MFYKTHDGGHEQGLQHMHHTYLTPGEKKECQLYPLTLEINCNVHHLHECNHQQEEAKSALEATFAKLLK